METDDINKAKKGMPGYTQKHIVDSIGRSKLIWVKVSDDVSNHKNKKTAENTLESTFDSDTAKLYREWKDEVAKEGKTFEKTIHNITATREYRNLTTDEAKEFAIAVNAPWENTLFMNAVVEHFTKLSDSRLKKETIKDTSGAEREVKIAEDKKDSANLLSDKDFGSSLKSYSSAKSNVKRLEDAKSLYGSSSGHYNKEELQKHKDVSSEQAKKLRVHDMMIDRYEEGKVMVYAAPGAMKVAEDHPHEYYNVHTTTKKIEVPGGNAKYERYISVPTDEEIEKHKEGRKKLLNDVSSGKVAWFTPGGYSIKVKFSKNEKGDTDVTILARPNSAIGNSLKLKQYSMKGYSDYANYKEMSKYSREEMRKVLKSLHGKRAEYM
jgi:hypothetical protein